MFSNVDNELLLTTNGKYSLVNSRVHQALSPLLRITFNKVKQLAAHKSELSPSLHYTGGNLKTPVIHFSVGVACEQALYLDLTTESLIAG